ncbi:E3 ubiquitin-protein ligase RNF14-like isoform X2 [Panicum miliaceum]|uniref:E3 ubiquitin-protein ligase RNF14-like isoform X2 n=1 Tax=Panicum miliaceum TaxID=4540 RepID=A0A3L6RSC0_PANMI|nr:E3 ubiquitin-protein ligase RNF14-like isoform X2 [Panicum miliaceum]
MDMDIGLNDSSLSANSLSLLSRGVSGQSIRRDSPMSSGASSSSSPPPAEAVDGYWAAREEAAARLEAMAARPLGEDELSAEQLETNNQLQEDEVLALQAIYGDDMIILEDKAGLRSFQERHQRYSMTEKQLLKEQGEIDELLNVIEVLRDSKQCPSCKMAISKTAGCNKMTCRNCGKFFCYRCNQAISGYNHFWYGDCVLFEDTNQGRRFGLYEEPDDDEDEDQEELEPELPWLYPCPICGRQNEKLGTNNHILCMGCRGHYCALCRKRVLKSSEHFGARGCQQHTDP